MGAEKLPALLPLGHPKPYPQRGEGGTSGASDGWGGRTRKSVPPPPPCGRSPPVGVGLTLFVPDAIGAIKGKNSFRLRNDRYSVAKAKTPTPCPRLSSAFAPYESVRSSQNRANQVDSPCFLLIYAVFVQFFALV